METMTKMVGDDYPALKGVELAAEDSNNQYADQIKSWTSYTQYMAAFDGVVRTVDSVLYKVLDGKGVYKELDGVLRALYAAVQGVDKEFLEGIQDMKAGKAPTFDTDPAKIPDWPDPSSSDSGSGVGQILDSIWQTVKPILELILSKVKASSSPKKAAFEAAVVGLINSGDKVISELKRAFG